MIDITKIATDTEVTLKLPRIIEVQDYHDFAMYQNILQNDLGLGDVYVTEVGYFDGQYLGLVHMDTESHNQLVLMLDAHFAEE